MDVDKTPHEVATSQKPDLSNVHPWGCKAWVKQLDVGKLDPRAELCYFVGIDSESKGFRVYWPGKNRVSIKRDVYFNENNALMHDKVFIEGETDTCTNSNLPQSSQSQIHPMTTQNNPIEPKIVPDITSNSNNDSALPNQENQQDETHLKAFLSSIMRTLVEENIDRCQHHTLMPP